MKPSPDLQSDRRILIVDDNPAIHEDFRKILTFQGPADAELDQGKQLFFDEHKDTERSGGYQIDSAFQGEEGYSLVRRSVEAGGLYAMAFVDLRMPPGWDGIETIKRIWEICPTLEIVICTAYSDYSWDYIHRVLGPVENLLILMKPCDKVEVLQIADCFTRRWQNDRQNKAYLAELEQTMQQQAKELEEAQRRLAELTAALQSPSSDEAKLARAAQLIGHGRSIGQAGADSPEQVARFVLRMLRTAQLLSKSPLSPAQKDHAQSILENGWKLLQLIEGGFAAQDETVTEIRP
jgi:CheY-like chemotaxis protein